MLDLAFLNQFPDRTRHVLNGHLWVGAVLVKQVNGIYPQSLQGGLGHLTDALGATVRAFLWGRFAVRTRLEAEFGGNGHLILKWFQNLADEFLIREGAIDLRRVKEGHAALDGLMEEGDHLLLCRQRDCRQNSSAYSPDPVRRPCCASTASIRSSPPSLF